MEEELKNIAPELSRLRQKKEAFQLPEGYFESFEARVMDRISAGGHLQETPLKVLKKPAKRMYPVRLFMAAAAAVALVLAAVWFLQPAAPEVQTLAAVELSEEEIEAYLLENAQYLEIDQLAMLPETSENVYQAPVVDEKTPSKSAAPIEITPEDVEHLLNDMTEEELEEIL